MRQRLDIVGAETRTKIRAKYLRALENEEWSLLPGPTFVRTFLRTYAEAVGLDPHALVEAYRTQQDDGDEPVSQQAPAASPRRRQARPARGGRQSERRRPPSSSGPPGPAAVLGGAVVLIVVGLLLLGILGGDDGDSTDQSAQKTQTTPAKTTAKRPAKRPAPKKPAAPAGVTVLVEPTAPTYVCMDSGDGAPKVFEGILDEKRTFKNARELRINLGKRAVKVTANGKPVTIAPSAEPLGLRVTRTGATVITDGPRPCA